MRAFGWFMAMFGIGFAVMAFLTYPAWAGLHSHWPDLAFHRVGGRVGQLVLLVCLVLMARRLGVADRASWGYGLPRKEFLRELVNALGLGIATMVPIIVIMALMGLRVWKDGVAPDAAELAKLTLKGF